MEANTWRKSSRSAANGNCVQVQWQTAASCEGGACVEIGWQTSKQCTSDGCVEVHQCGDQFVVRDSKDKDGPVLTFTRDEWDAFVGGVKDGEFDL